MLTWGLLTLLRIEPKVYNQGEIAENEYKHLILVLDVSPSMSLVDAGEDQKATRRNRASEILDSMFSRIPLRQYLISVIAVYSDAKPVLEDSRDVEVVRYILEELPMYHAFKPGKTNLFEGLSAAAHLAKTWNPNSAVVVVLTDGDTVPATGMPKMPVSISKVLVVGVGDSSVGAFIDGHQSRQDISTLRQVANRLHGIYHNGNQKQLSSQTINELIQSANKDERLQLTVREWALLATLVGSSLLVGIQVLLPLFGTGFRGGRRIVADTIDSNETFAELRSMANQRTTH
jgi:Ca-activated chloride channel family protein